MFGLPGIPGFGFISDLNPFDEPKKTSMSTIASNVFLLLCCTMIVTSIWSHPLKFRMPPLFMSLVVACLCSSLAGKNIYDESRARFVIEAEGSDGESDGEGDDSQ